MVYFITGGERSGKSKYAMQLALSLSENPAYIATARIWDKDFEKRIEHHKKERDERWTNIEEEKYLSSVDIKNSVAVIDCVTLWLTNFYIDNAYDIDRSIEEAIKELDNLLKKSTTWIIISNEIGMGVHATTDSGRKFVELQGWLNQYIASKANKVILMVSGIPLKIKDE